MRWDSDPTHCQAASARDGQQCIYIANHPDHGHRSISEGRDDESGWIEAIPSAWHVYHLQAEHHRRLAEKTNSPETAAWHAQMATMYATIELTELLRGNRNA